MQKHSPFFLDSMTGAKNRRGIGDIHILDSFVYLFHVVIYRRKVQVDEILVHENYTAGGSKENDIALLRLGEKTFCCHSTLWLGETSKQKFCFFHFSLEHAPCF